MISQCHGHRFHTVQAGVSTSLHLLYFQRFLALSSSVKQTSVTYIIRNIKHCLSCAVKQGNYSVQNADLYLNTYYYGLHICHQTACKNHGPYFQRVRTIDPTFAGSRSSNMDMALRPFRLRIIHSPKSW